MAGGLSFIGFGIVMLISTILGASLRTSVVTSQFTGVFGTPPSLENQTAYGFASNPLPNSTLDAGMRHIADNAFSFQASFLISALGLALLIPGVLALYIAIRDVRRTPALVGVVLALAGSVVELAGLPSAFSGIIMAQQYVSATTDAQRAAFAASVLGSNETLNFGSILGGLLVDSAILLGGYVISKSVLGKATGYLGMFAGGAGIITAFLPYDLYIVGSFLSIFSLVFVFVIGVQLTRLARRIPLAQLRRP